jgi:hypothetical protein
MKLKNSDDTRTLKHGIGRQCLYRQCLYGTVFGSHLFDRKYLKKNQIALIIFLNHF